MPFTFSHPAIVLPLTFLPKRWFSLTALVIGSLTPDFEYFIRMKVQSNFSHTIFGIFWFDLPLGILLAFIFHNIVRNSLFNNLPLLLQSRLTGFNQFNWNRYFISNWHIASISFLLGAFSHIFWDSFTHEHGHFVEVIPELSRTILFFGKEILFFKVLQHSSTLIGGFAIILSLSQIPSKANVAIKVNTRYWIVVATISLSVILLRLFGGLDYRAYGHLIVSAISSMMLSLILTPIFFCLTKKLSTEKQV
jgi:hypothetical protein